ncbi:MAG TPA: hypothetical protein P5560_11225 [Thermotogota bacterium]|nr:hypothetical protein [Thermotogota bacterium]
MKKILWIAVCASIMLVVLSGCFPKPTPTPKIHVKDLGKQGDLREADVAYQVLDFSFLDVRSLSVKRTVLVAKLGEASLYGLRLEGKDWTFRPNPLDAQILEVNLPLDTDIEQIQQALVRVPSSRARWPNREGITLQSVILQKSPPENGTDLFEVESTAFISMRNAGQFVFDQMGVLIQPMYVKSSESFTYTAQDFLSARNAAPDSSIDGAFTFLKGVPNHEAILQQVYPNQVSIQEGQIVVDPNPMLYRRLKDLGPQGNLTEQGNAYNILDNRETLGVWSVAFRLSSLPEPQNAWFAWQLRMGENRFRFTQNRFDPDIMELSIPDTTTSDPEQIRNALLQELETFLVSLQTVPNTLGFVRFAGQEWGSGGTERFPVHESISLEATATQGAFFTGWYENDTLLAEETHFSLQVGAERNLQARFSTDIPVGRAQTLHDFSDAFGEEGLSVHPGLQGTSFLTGVVFGGTGGFTDFHGKQDLGIVKCDANGNVLWQKLWGGTEDEILKCALPTPDGGLLFAADTESFNGDFTEYHGLRDAWLVQLDAQGDIAWQTNLGGSGYESVDALLPWGDAKYLAAGTTSSTDSDFEGFPGSSDIWIAQLSEQGAVEWLRSLGGSATDVFHSLVATSDGGAVLFANTASTDGEVVHIPEQGQGWMVKLDAQGQVEWDGTTGMLHAVLPLSDGILLVEQHADWVRVRKCDNAGQTLWEADFGSVEQATVNARELQNGNLLLWKAPAASGAPLLPSVQLKAWDPSGAQLWQKTLGGSGNDTPQTVFQTPAGELFIAATTFSNDGDVSGNHGSGDAWLVKSYSSGDVAWQRCYGGFHAESLRAAIPTIDGGIVLLADSASTDGDLTGLPRPFSSWLLKLDDHGNPLFHWGFEAIPSGIQPPLWQNQHGDFLLLTGWGTPQKQLVKVSGPS